MVVIELEVVPMAMGFTIGALMFLVHRLFAVLRPEPEEKEAEEAVDDVDDETWLAAHGAAHGLLPVTPSIKKDQDGLEVIGLSAKVAAAADDPESAPELGAEPAPEPPIEAMAGQLPAGTATILAPALQAQQLQQRQRALRPVDILVLFLIAAFWVGYAVEFRHKQERRTPDPVGQEPEPVVETILPKANALTVPLTREHSPTEIVDGVMYHRSAYWGTLLVGDPPAPFTVVFDTGSGHLILPSTYCRTEVCRARRRYRSTASRTSKNINHDGAVVKATEIRDQITISFGTGEVSGVFMEDRICMQKDAGAVGLSRRCMPMRMIAATEMSEDPFQEFSFDGVLGLGLPGLSETPEFNFLSVLAQNLGHPASRHAQMFGLFLADGQEEETEEQSEITLGGYDDDRFDGDLLWNEVVDPKLGQWMIAVKSLRVGNQRISYCSEGCRAIMDTGTSMLTVPTDIFAELFELLRHTPANGKDCRGGGPSVHFELESITLTLEPQDYAHFEEAQEVRTSTCEEQDQSHVEEPCRGGENDTAQEERAVPSVTTESAMCKAMLMTLDLPEPIGPKLFILGEPVLRKYYTVYDSTVPPRVGLGRVRKSRWAQEQRRQQLGLRS